MSSDPWKRSDWNDIVDQINNLSSNPDTNCTGISSLPEVGPEHIWTKGDIIDVRNQLLIICPDTVFNKPLELWNQATIDEINAAIDAGWCQCPTSPCDSSGFVSTTQAFFTPSFGEGSGDCSTADDLMNQLNDAIFGYPSGYVFQMTQYVNQTHAATVYANRLPGAAVLIAEAQQNLKEAQAEVSAWQSIVSSDDPPNAKNQQALDTANQALLDANNILSDAHAAVSNVQNLIDEANSNADTAKSNAEAQANLADSLQATWLAAVQACQVFGFNFIEPIQSFTTPWTDLYTPEKWPRGVDVGDACEPSYSITFPNGSPIGSGNFTPNGLPYGTVRNSIGGTLNFVSNIPPGLQ
jgi:hypothetical protein